MNNLWKVICATLIVFGGMAAGGTARAQIAQASGHYTCARYGLSFDVPAGWSKVGTNCGSGEVYAGYESKDSNGIMLITGIPFPGQLSTSQMKTLLNIPAKEMKIPVKPSHFTSEVIGGVRFLEERVSGTNKYYKVASWNLLAATSKNGIELAITGLVNQHGNGHAATEKKAILHALHSMRFSKPTKAVKSAPQAPTSYCDQDSHVCVSASNLHRDSGGDSPPPPGSQFAVVHIKLVNQGNQSYDYNEFDFVLKGADTHVDYQPDAIDLNISNSSLGAGTLLPGDIVEGDLAFQTPSGEESYSLHWQASPLGDYASVPIN